MTDSLLKSLIDIATLITLVATLAVVYWQSGLIRRTLEADAFERILERAESIGLSEILDLINNQCSFTDYDAYKDSEFFRDHGHQVRKLIDFFNDLSHLARSEYIDDYYPIRLYFPSLLTCKRSSGMKAGVTTLGGSGGFVMKEKIQACTETLSWCANMQNIGKSKASGG